MALSLAQLLAPASVGTWRSLLLSALQGLGVVSAGGLGGGSTQLGTGGCAISGTPASPACPCNVVAQISTSGEPGAAQVQLSYDGGNTFGAAATIPSNSAVALGSTGVTATFSAGPLGAGTSFVAGDTFAFALNVSTLAVTSWQSGGAYRTLVEIEAQALADVSSAVSGIAAGGLTTTSTGSWLDLLAQNFYGLTRNQAQVATVQVTLTAASGAGPYTIAAGAISVSDAFGHVFTSTAGGTISYGSPLTLAFAAQQAGSAYNIVANQLTTIVAGTLAGVTTTNAGPAAGGTDTETDSALALRCQQRWPALSTGATAAVYALWTVTADASITRSVVVADPTIAGQVDVYLAGSSGPATSGAVSNANSYIQARIPLCSTAVVTQASAVSLTITGGVVYSSSKTTSAAVQAAVTAALNAYVNGLALGDGSGTTKIYWAELVAAIASQYGVVNLTGTATLLNGGNTDITLTLGQVAQLVTNSLVFTGI